MVNRKELMEKVTVVKYKTDCGKLYSTKCGAKKHEKNCCCWKNPKLKTCMTCVFGKLITDSNGMEHEPQNLHVWKQWECFNELFDYDEHYTQADGDYTESLCIHCPKHQLAI